MGRWGDDIYESDTSLDFLAEIKSSLMKEAAYVFALERGNVYSNITWLRDALTIIEMMNIFAEPDQDHFGLPVFLRDYGAAITRWREAFFLVWDDKWEGIAVHNFPPDPALYNHYDYRVEHRHIAAALFDRLNDIADYWRDDLSEHDLQPFVYMDELPLFSVRSQDHRGRPDVGGFFYDLIIKLTQHIGFTFSEESMERGLDYSDIETVSVAVDLIGSLCEIYRASPGLRPATVQRWLDKVISIWIGIYSDDPENLIDAQTLAEKDGLYANVVTIFVRLITVAQQYPGRFEI
jgi:hypothetical protein